MYKSITEINNTLGIAEDGTYWNLVTDEYETE